MRDTDTCWYCQLKEPEASERLRRRVRKRMRRAMRELRRWVKVLRANVSIREEQLRNFYLWLGEGDNCRRGREGKMSPGTVKAWLYFTNFVQEEIDKIIFRESTEGRKQESFKEWVNIGKRCLGLQRFSLPGEGVLTSWQMAKMKEEKTNCKLGERIFVNRIEVLQYTRAQAEEMGIFYFVSSSENWGLIWPLIC